MMEGVEQNNQETKTGPVVGQNNIDEEFEEYEEVESIMKEDHEGL